MVNFKQLGQYSLEHFHDIRRKVGTFTATDMFQNFLDWPRILVWSLHAERIEYICQGNNACRLWNGIPLQSVRISAAIPFFVMTQRHFGGQLKYLGIAFAQNVVAELRMLFHDHPLVVGQWPGLAQNGMRYAQLAGVVHRRRQFQPRTGCFIPAVAARQRAGICRHAPDVGAGIGVVVMSGMAQHQDRLTVTAFQRRRAHQRQMGTDARPYHCRRYRLADIVDAAGIEAGRLMCHISVAGNENDLDFLRHIHLLDFAT